ncbi:MAG: hypothetical protein LBR27_11935 [Bifidobacteriaceae bacterium]|jgi:hypothetical protein|nr:hypothetical protein [Bifidobacteriaceae bacterium]
MKLILKRLLALVGAIGGGLLLTLVLAAAPAQAASWDDDDYSSSSGSRDIGMYLGMIGVAGIASGPIFYATVTKRYSLTDDDDPKDQAIRSKVSLQRSSKLGRPNSDTLVVTYRKRKGQAVLVATKRGGSGRPQSTGFAAIGDLFKD